VITELAVGEALVSFLDEKGSPGVVERAWIMPPTSQIGPISAEQRKSLIEGSVLFGQYEKAVDRVSAYEMLTERATQASVAGEAQAGAETKEEPGILSGVADALKTAVTGKGGRRQGVVEAMAKSAARQIGNQIGSQIVRGVLGSLLGGKR
jgi:hypothetical protein